MKHQRSALALLVAGMMLSYGWQWVPDEFTGFAWNILTSVFVIVLLVVIGVLFASREVWSVVILLAAFKAAVIGCDAWWLVAPWPVEPGQGMCSARLNWPLGIIGLSLGVLLAAKLYRGKP